MRFSEMMGSEAEQRSEPPAPSETDDVAASALAPYLDGGAPGEPVAAVDRNEPLDRAEPSDRVARFDGVAPGEPGATAIADFTPLSDDLLPRRR